MPKVSCQPSGDITAGLTLFTRSTNNCTTRGKCNGVTRAEGETLYFCECASSDYAGNACELEDIHADFHLIFWTTVFFLVALIAAIGFLFAGDSGKPGASAGAYAHPKTD